MSAKRILIIDDEKDVLDLIKKRLESSGFLVDVAMDGQEGLQKVKESRPDLVITDIVMPVMDGFAFYKALLSDQGLAGIAVLVLSGRKKMEESFRALGVEHFLSKPFEAQGLLDKVNQILDCDKSVQVKSATSLKAAFLGKKILIAGSAKSVLAVMRDLLEGQGHLVECVLDGPHAVVKAVEFLPDVIILDIALGDIPSFEIVRTLRYLPVIKTKNIFLINTQDASGNRDASGVESVASVDQVVEDCKQAGISQYVGPFKEMSFLKTISKYL
jgi:CheY-like chemotaxis protein